MTSNPSKAIQSEERFGISVLEKIQQEVWPFISLGEPKDQRKRKLTLVDCGPDKGSVMRCVRDLFRLSLLDAKRLVDSVPMEVPIKPTTDQSYDALPTAIRETIEALTDAGAIMESDPEEEWQISAYEQDLFSTVPNLTLSPEWKLYSQVYSGPHEGFGRLWAMPNARHDWREQPDLQYGYRPTVHYSIAEALQGDSTVESYQQASVLMREIDTMNGRWTDTDWSSHRLIDRPTDHAWEWIQDEVSAESDLQPAISQSEEGTITIRFFTVSRLGQVRLIRHQDHYTPGCYLPQSDVLLCATGGQGYVH